MKNKENRNLLIVGCTILVLLIIPVVRASLSWNPTYTPIPPLTEVALTPSTPVQIGTWNAGAPIIYVQSTNSAAPGSTNLFVRGRISFDGVNWTIVNQRFQQQGATNAPLNWTNFSFAVYGSLTITNQDAAVTNGVNVTSP